MTRKSELIENIKKRIRNKTDTVMAAEIMNGILRAVIYIMGMAEYIILCDKRDKSFLTYVISEKRWSEAMIHNLERRQMFCEGIKYADEESRECGDVYFGLIDGYILYKGTAERIRSFQEEVNRKSLSWVRDSYAAKLCKAADMAAREEIYAHCRYKQKFYNWIVTAVFATEHTGTRQRLSKNTYEVVCGACRKEDIIKGERPKGHICKRCGCVSRLKDKRRLPGRVRSDFERIVIYVRVGAMICAVRYNVSMLKVSEGVLIKPWLSMSLYDVAVILPDGKYVGSIDGDNGKFYGWNVQSTAVAYPYNFDEAVGSTALERSAYGELIRAGLRVQVSEPEKYRENERLAKAGLARLVSESAREYGCRFYDRRTVAETLAISNSYVKLCKRFDVSYAQYEMLKLMHDAGYTADVALELLELLARRRDVIYRYGVSRMREQQIEDVLRQRNPKRLLEYLEGEGVAISDYMDYMEACEKLGENVRDTKVAYPKDFTDRHDLMTRRVTVMEDKKLSDKLKQRYYENIYTYGYADGEYFVTVPKTAREFEVEGDKLRHCVHRMYMSKHADGSTVILFVRRIDRPFEPMVTAELCGSECRQIRGYQNSAPAKEVMAFWSEYLKTLESRIKCACVT